MKTNNETIFTPEDFAAATGVALPTKQKKNTSKKKRVNPLAAENAKRAEEEAKLAHERAVAKRLSTYCESLISDVVTTDSIRVTKGIPADDQLAEQPLHYTDFTDGLYLADHTTDMVKLPLAWRHDNIIKNNVSSLVANLTQFEIEIEYIVDHTFISLGGKNLTYKEIMVQQYLSGNYNKMSEYFASHFDDFYHEVFLEDEWTVSAIRLAYKLEDLWYATLYNVARETESPLYFDDEHCYIALPSIAVLWATWFSQLEAFCRSTATLNRNVFEAVDSAENKD